MRITSPLLLPLCCLLAGACSSERQETPELARFPWDFERVADLDTDDSRALLGGYAGQGIAVDASGRVSMVTDAWEGVHRFSHNGQWTANLGGEGQGPGEFQYAFGIAAKAEGDLLVYDYLLRRLTHLLSDGSYLRSLPISITPLWKSPFGFGGSDRYWIFQSSTNRPIETLLLISAEGDTLTSITSRVSTSTIRASRRLILPNPAARDIRWTVDAMGTAWILTSSRNYLLKVRPSPSDPDTVWVTLPRLNLSDHEWRTFLGAQMDSLSTNPDFEQYGDSLRQMLENAVNDLNPIQQMWCVDQYGILVDRSLRVLDARPQSTGRYAAVLTDGSFTNDVEGPARIVWAANGYAVQLHTVWGELPEVTLWRLVPLEKGSQP